MESSLSPMEIAQAGFLLTLTNAAVAVLAFSVITFVMLRAADWLSGLNLRKAIDVVETDPKALALYLGARYFVLGIGNALILASIFMYS